jgi:hypothetical protein
LIVIQLDYAWITHENMGISSLSLVHLAFIRVNDSFAAILNEHGQESALGSSGIHNLDRDPSPHPSPRHREEG